MKDNTKRILIFLGITFAITYFVEIAVIAPRAGSTDVNEALLAQTLVGTIMFVPAIGALLTRAITKEGFAVREMYFVLNINEHKQYYGLVWLGFAALTVLGAVLYFLLFPKTFDPEMSYAAAVLYAQTGEQISTHEVQKTILMQMATALFLAPLLNFVNCLGEEWGWRCYLLPRLLEQFKVVPAVVLNGIIWGLWHAPLIVMGHNYGTGYPGYPYVGILAMCLFCVVIGISLCYVTIKTNSCIPAIIGHGMINGFSTSGIYFTSLENPYNIFLGPVPVGIIGGCGFIVLAGVLLWKLYKEEQEKEKTYKNSAKAIDF